MKLSILMPVFNEEARLPEALKQALAVDYPCEIELVVVDDGSTDGTREILAGTDDPRVRIILHERNQGKGAAIMTAVTAATGEYMVILDADLEYDPAGHPAPAGAGAGGPDEGGLRQPHLRQPLLLLVLVRDRQPGRHHRRQHACSTATSATWRPASS